MVYMDPFNFSHPEKLGHFANWAFMNEAAGNDDLINTRQARLNAVIKDFQAAKDNGYDINDDDIQEQILENHNFNEYDMLSEKEERYISNHIR